MRVLLDEQLPLDLAADLTGHAADTVVGRGWAGLKNGDLLRRMSSEYDVLITMDRNIEFQQRTSALPFEIIVLHARSNRISDLRPLIPSVLAAIKDVASGQLQHVGGNDRGGKREVSP
jgi:predicted nuclease of predicted toxin-antitoxin system